MTLQKTCYTHVYYIMLLLLCTSYVQAIPVKPTTNTEARLPEKKTDWSISYIKDDMSTSILNEHSASQLHKMQDYSPYELLMLSPYLLPTTGQVSGKPPTDLGNPEHAEINSGRNIFPSLENPKGDQTVGFINPILTLIVVGTLGWVGYYYVLCFLSRAYRAERHRIYSKSVNLLKSKNSRNC